MTTQADRLTERVAFQRPVIVIDALGQEVETWQTVVEIWAEVRALSTRQWLASAQIQTDITHQIVIRHRAGVLSTWRVLWRGERLHIVGEPVPMGAREWLRINAESRARDETDDLPVPPPIPIPAGSIALGGAGALALAGAGVLTLT